MTPRPKQRVRLTERPRSSANLSFRGQVWTFKGPGGWHFVTLPSRLAKSIRAHFRQHEGAWGRLDVVACLGKTRWETAIWYDSKAESYLLPLKSDIRKKEEITVGQRVNITLEIRSSTTGSPVRGPHKTSRGRSPSQK